MKKSFLLLIAVTLWEGTPALAQDLVNAGATITVQAGTILYVGPGGLSNQVGGTLTSAGTLRVDGPLANSGTLDLGTGTLEVHGNFANSGTLLPGTSPVTFSGPADQLLTPGGAALYQVLVNKPTAGANTLRLAGDLTVSNALTLTNGLVNTRNGATVHTLRLPNGATLSGEAAGRYVLGALQITRNAVSGAAVNFGHGAILDPTTNNLGAVDITRTAGLLTDDVSRGVNFANSALKGIDRIWTVVPATQPSAAVQLTLSWLADNDNGITDFSQARIYGQAATGQPWAVRGPVANAAARSIAGSFTTLARFTVSNAANPLPVTLLDFRARAEGPAVVRLAWTTASEKNSQQFEVERSADGVAFARIGTVAAAGSSSSPRTYGLVDAQLPGAALLYYRLKQVDDDGTFAYSPVRSVTLDGKVAEAGLALFPNPVRAGGSTLTGAVPGTMVTVFDALGRQVMSATADASGTAALARPGGAYPVGLATGVYVVRSGSQALRLVVE